MQAYGEAFARVYNNKWSGFAKQVAPLILEFYESTPDGSQKKTLLDLCCGTGQFSVHFLEKGYRVVGIDMSEHMLRYAEENARDFIDTGQGKFVKADASRFELDERFGLVVSTYDSLNHLESEEALVNCFQCVHAVNDGYFIFDLNTRSGLRNWNGAQVDDRNDEELVIARGKYDGKSDKALLQITCFVRNSSGLYQRCDEIVYNTVYSMDMVRNALLEAGWNKVHFARITDLSVPLDDPEKEGRVFVVAGR